MEILGCFSWAHHPMVSDETRGLMFYMIDRLLYYTRRCFKIYEIDSVARWQTLVRRTRFSRPILISLS